MAQEDFKGSQCIIIFGHVEEKERARLNAFIHLNSFFIFGWVPSVSVLMLYYNIMYITDVMYMLYPRIGLTVHFQMLLERLQLVRPTDGGGESFPFLFTISYAHIDHRHNELHT